MRTLDEIEASTKNVLSVEDIRGILCIDPNAFRDQAREDKKKHNDSFGFPVIVIRNHVKIPKEPFVKYMRGDQFQKVEPVAKEATEPLVKGETQ